MEYFEEIGSYDVWHYLEVSADYAINIYVFGIIDVGQ